MGKRENTSNAAHAHVSKNVKRRQLRSLRRVLASKEKTLEAEEKKALSSRIEELEKSLGEAAESPRPSQPKKKFVEYKQKLHSKIRFFERQKLLRQIRRCRADIAGLVKGGHSGNGLKRSSLESPTRICESASESETSTEADTASHATPEGSNARESFPVPDTHGETYFKKMEHLRQLQRDLIYVENFPLNVPYISLFPSKESKDQARVAETARKRERIRRQIDARLKAARELALLGRGVEEKGEADAFFLTTKAD